MTVSIFLKVLHKSKTLPVKRSTINYLGTIDGFVPLYITNCTITAPNRYTFPTVHGSKTSFAEVDVTDYFGNPNNTPLNGKWTVTITSSKSLSGLTFKIGGWARTILGKKGK